MLKSSTLTLYLSSSTIALLTPSPTLSATIARQLKQIATEFAPVITTLLLPNNPNILDQRVTIILGAATHELLLRAALSNPSLSISAAVDGLLEKALSPVFSMISENNLIMEKIDSYPLPYGCLVAQYKNRDVYWLWRYPHRSGKPKDKYLGKGLDRAIAKARAIGIPKDAAAKRLNKGKKLWASA
jgi:hypothetical protein